MNIDLQGFRDNYHKNEKHKLDEHWDNYESYGTFKKFGKKAHKKLNENKKKNKNQNQKVFKYYPFCKHVLFNCYQCCYQESKSRKETKKKDESKKKSGGKSETGHNKDKKSDSHYNHGSQYHIEKKSKKHHKKNT